MVFTRLSRLLSPRSVSLVIYLQAVLRVCVCASFFFTSILLLKLHHIWKGAPGIDANHSKHVIACFTTIRCLSGFSDSICRSNSVLLAALLHVLDIRAPGDVSNSVWFGFIFIVAIEDDNGWKVNRSAPTLALSTFLRHSLRKCKANSLLG